MIDVKISADNQDELLLIYLARDLYLSDEKLVEKSSELELVRNITENFHSAATSYISKHTQYAMGNYFKERYSVH